MMAANQHMTLMADSAMAVWMARFTGAMIDHRVGSFSVVFGFVVSGFGAAVGLLVRGWVVTVLGFTCVPF